MKAINSTLRAQLRLLLLLYVPILLGLGAIAIVRRQTGIHLSFFMEDPASITDTPFYTGVFSNIGILLWCASATVCLLSSAILFKAGGDKNIRSFFLYSGLMISVLLLDDFFLLHETVFPDYLHIPQNLILAGYGLMALLYVLRFRKMLLDLEQLPLFFAFGFLGLSVFFDVLPFRIPAHLLFEEGSKLLGIASFLVYFAGQSTGQINLLFLRQQRTTANGVDRDHRKPGFYRRAA